jgi:hypothetical protein
MTMDRSALGAVAKRETTELQADASFLENVPLVELHKSNILKLEMEELLHECRMSSDSAAPSKDYISILSNLVSKIATSSKNNKDVVGCPFVLQSDKVATTTIAMPSKLTLVPTGSHALPNCGTKKAGNANVLPTLDCAVVVPNDYWNTKDYLNHRYMDVSALQMFSVRCTYRIHGSTRHRSLYSHHCPYPLYRNETLFSGKSPTFCRIRNIRSMSGRSNGDTAMATSRHLL